MATELQFQLLASEAVYSVIRDATTGEVADIAGEVFGVWDAADTHDVTTTVDAGLLASADVPSWVAAGYYFGVCYHQEGASPADGDPVRSVGEIFYWNGTSKIQPPKNSEQSQGGLETIS